MTCESQLESLDVNLKDRKFIVLIGAGVETPFFPTFTKMVDGRAVYMAEDMTFKPDVPSQLKILRNAANFKLKEQKLCNASVNNDTYALLDKMAELGLIRHILSMNITSWLSLYPNLHRICTYIHGMLHVLMRRKKRQAAMPQVPSFCRLYT
jgi:hypothetical protein